MTAYLSMKSGNIVPVRIPVMLSPLLDMSVIMTVIQEQGCIIIDNGFRITAHDYNFICFDTR